MTNSILARDHVAVITGGASGIGLACAKRFATLGMAVCIADLDVERVVRAVDDIASASPDGHEGVMGMEIDVRHRQELERLEAAVTARFGGTDLLMNNAAVGGKGDVLGLPDYWERVMATNLWGVIHGSQVFAPAMIARGRPGLIINTGSKQGITTPPGNPAYNVAKAGVKVYTEALEHELRNTANSRIQARLLIPGFVLTGMSANPTGSKPPAAWTPQQLAEYLIAALAREEFYILCPDNEVDRELDCKRILWSAGDVVQGRPPLSRWHPDFEEAFKRWVLPSM